MAVLSNVLKGSVKITSRIKKLNITKPQNQQKRVLIKLLTKARSTKFGEAYGFNDILNQLLFEKGNNRFSAFKENVPIFDYNSLYEQWWQRCHNGEENICWPGKIKYFALSSGTSGSPSKHIPVSKEMIKAINRAGVNQIIALGNYDNLPENLFDKSYLMLGGSTQLAESEGRFEGDLSGITTGNIPFWFENFFKPGREIAQVKDWEQKLQEITNNAPNWDIGFLAGVPAWIQILCERVIEKYNLKNIHEIWPNLSVYGWGGVSFEPYKNGFEKLMGKPMIYIETYLASEGFIAYQARPNANLQLILNNGIFFEFVPFNEENFDENGEIKQDAQTLLITEVEPDVDYALLISTCSGAWRYLIGDTVKFTNVAKCEIKITGRTKQFLSLCGEHISVDNLNNAVDAASKHFNITIKEFTVTGIPHSPLFAHQWYIGTDDEIDEAELGRFIDKKLHELNDDYAVERRHALKNVFCKVLPTASFLDYMKSKGKVGGQNKFPRVLKGAHQAEWESYIFEKTLLV